MSSNLSTYAREFVAICAHIQKKHPAQHTATSLYVEQVKLVQLLDKNKYEEATTKLAVWRNMQWIDCQLGRFSRNTKIDGRQLRRVHLRLSVYEQLRLFLGGNRDGN